MSVTIITIPAQQAGHDIRIQLLNHNVDSSDISIDMRDLFGPWQQLLRTEYRHRIERTETDEQHDRRCRCCDRHMAAADSDQTVPETDRTDGALPEPHMPTLHSTCYEIQMNLARMVDRVRLQRDHAEQQAVELRAEIQRLQGLVQYGD